MSSGGQVIGGVVGAVAGFFLGGGPTGALYGAQIGMMAGGYLDPPKGPTIEGPRLNDLSVQSSTYGAVIPRVYGTVTVNGNVFWLENNQIKPTYNRKKSGGKGGGSKTTTGSWSYSATFAVGLCKGPIAGVRRIWIGADLIYDAGSSDPATITASNDAAAGFHVYLGTDTQAPDARMQATLGVANTPAWRGLAYIVFYDLELARYGNSLMGAQVRAEVVTKGLTSPVYGYVGLTETAFPEMVPFNNLCWNGSMYLALSHNDRLFKSTDGVAWTALGFTSFYTTSFLIEKGGVFYICSNQNKIVYSSTDGVNWNAGNVNTGTIGSTCWNGTIFVGISGTNGWAVSSDGVSWTFYTSTIGACYSIAWTGSNFVALGHINGVVGTSVDGINWTARTSTPINRYLEHIFVDRGICLALPDINHKVQRVMRSEDGGVTWVDFTSPEFYWIGSDGANFLGVGLGPRPYYSVDGKTWTETQGAFWPWDSTLRPWSVLCWNGSYFITVESSALNCAKITRSVVTPGSAGITYLSEIVSSESLQSGLLTGGDIDVAALTSTVRGYRIGSVGAIRAALEPLQASWPFDVVQHGYQIKYIARGGASVVTIPGGDLDARSAGSESGVQITTSREMDSQLPRRVTVQHLDYDREYNTGTQYAERLNTAAMNARMLDLPIVLTATEAAGKAEVLLYLYWLERYDLSINLPPTYLHLEPGDIATLTTPEGQILVRIVTVNYTSDGRVECKAKYAAPAIYTPLGGTQPVYNAGAVYTPTAIGSSPAVSGPTTITPVGASVYALLDVPMISSAQSGPSFLAAMTGALAGWKGGVLMQSTDAGSSWASLQDFGPPGSSMGTCTNSIGLVESRLIDSASLLNVTLTQGALYSVTQLAMLGGSNHFAYGADGRWEIIAAQTCTLVSGTSYVLQNLLRGRFGSEWAMGLHAVSDALILLDTTDVAAIAMSTGTIGLSYLYRGVTVDRDISTDSNRAFAYAGVNLKPLSPIALTGNRDPSTNDWMLTWIRRTRDGGEWRDYVDASLGEASESYAIDVYADGSFATVKRTITASAPACVYASADQVSDFGANQPTLYLKLTQISATVGRGYPLTTSITR